MTSAFEGLRRLFTGVLTIEGFRPGAEYEYVSAGGSAVLVPDYAVQGLLDRGELHDFRFVRTVGRKTFEDYAHNLITNEGVEAIAKMLIDFSATYDTGIKRVEIGTGGGSAVTPTVDDVALVGGAVRFACNAPSQSGAVITVVTPTTTAGGNNIYIREIGVYVADNTSTISAGDLLSHASYDYDNSGGGAVNLTVTHTIDLSRFTGA